MSRHINDYYVKNSVHHGFRARSAFKLLQIFDSFPQIVSSIRGNNKAIVDLGSSPGSWSQVLSQYSSPSSIIVAIDLLPMKPINRVQFVSMNFTSEDAFITLKSLLKDGDNQFPVNLIVSDLCANLSGTAWIDNQKNLQLWNLALSFSILHLSENGHFILKYFESPVAQSFRKELEKNFERVSVFKPKASRAESSEKYFICLNKSIKLRK